MPNSLLTPSDPLSRPNPPGHFFMRLALLILWTLLVAAPALAQVPPSLSEVAAYRGLHAAAAQGDAAEVERLVSGGADVNAVDGHRRTPLHVAVHLRHREAAQALLKAGANPNALDAQAYDIVTIAAVND